MGGRKKKELKRLGEPGCVSPRAARRRSQSALPRETYYNRSRWSLAAEASKKLWNVESPSDPLDRGRKDYE